LNINNDCVYTQEKLFKRRLLVKKIAESAQNWDEAWSCLTNFSLKETNFKLASSSLFIYFSREEKENFLGREVIGVPTSFDPDNVDEVSLAEYGEENICRIVLKGHDFGTLSLSRLKDYYGLYKSKLEEKFRIKDHWRIEIDEKDIITGNFGNNMTVYLDFFVELI